MTSDFGHLGIFEEALLLGGAMKTSLTIRRLNDTDSISELTSLLHSAYKPLLEQGMRYLASHQDENKTRERCFKGETYLAIDREIVGTITLSTSSNTRGSPWYDRPDVASFGQFAVKPEYQKLGIGSKLLGVVENRARLLGVRELALDTAETASHLIHYYQLRNYRFIEHVKWDVTNYRSVILSKTLTISHAKVLGTADILA